MDGNVAISHGVVPGLIQSSDLAELYAVHSALCWALHYSARVCLHTDSEYVIKGLDHLRCFRQVPGCWRYHQVWTLVLEVLHLLDTDAWSVHFVPSHQDVTMATSALQEWFIHGNTKADQIAARAQELRPPSFVENHRRLREHEAVMKRKVQRHLQFLVAMARVDLASSEASSWDPEDVVLSTLMRPMADNQSELSSQLEGNFVQTLPRHLVDGFSFDFRSSLVRFILHCDQSAARAKFVSGLELLAVFVAAQHGRIPIPRLVDGIMVYECPDMVVGGNLIRPWPGPLALSRRPCWLDI